MLFISSGMTSMVLCSEIPLQNLNFPIEILPWLLLAPQYWGYVLMPKAILNACVSDKFEFSLKEKRFLLQFSHSTWHHSFSRLLLIFRNFLFFIFHYKLFFEFRDLFRRGIFWMVAAGCIYKEEISLLLFSSIMLSFQNRARKRNEENEFSLV